MSDEPASFNLDAVLRKLQEVSSSKDRLGGYDQGVFDTSQQPRGNSAPAEAE